MALLSIACAVPITIPTNEPQDAANVTFRLDHHISDKYSLFGRYVYNGSTTGNSTDEIFPGVGGIATPQQSHNIGLNFIATLRPDLVNELRAGVTRSDDGFFCNGVGFLNGFSTPDQYGNGTDYSFITSTNVSTIANLGCNGLGDSNGQARRAGTWDVGDTLSWVKGNHSIKVGAEFRYVYDNGYDDFSSRPTIDFTANGNFGIPIVNCGTDPQCADPNIAQAIQGNTALASREIRYCRPSEPLCSASLAFSPRRSSITPRVFGPPSDFRMFVQHEYGGFFQDSWKMRQNLTLYYGMRYQFDGVPFERNGNLSNLLYQQPSDPGPITFQTVGPGTGRQMYFSDPLNFEPRAGLAWDPFHDGKTSVRMGYGIFHDRIFGNIFTNLKGDPPFVNNVQNYPNVNFANGIGSPVLVESVPTPATQPAPTATLDEGGYISGITVLSRTIKNPYTQSWNAGIQRQLGNGMTLEVNYVGSGSHRLLRSVDGNPPLPWLVAADQANGTLDPSIFGGCASRIAASRAPASHRQYGVRRADCHRNRRKLNL